jgi:membrane-associated phospholipid phosphatase
MSRLSTSLTTACAIMILNIWTSNRAESAAAQDNPVIQWNKTLLTIVRTPGAQPATVHPTRSFAVMHAAMYDAVNAIDGTHRPYLVRLERISPHASQDAAAASSAHEVLTALYPTQQTTIDTQLDQSLNQIPDGADKTEGVAIGKAVADALLDLRSDDNSSAPPIPYVFGAAPGDYQSTPPNFPSQPVFTHWSRVTPFALTHANQFRPGPPPALTSTDYTQAFIEVKSLGIANSTSVTADQAFTGKFWNGAIQNYWNEIAQTAAQSRQLTTAQSARLFALLNFTIADGVIAFYDAKYTYNRWRPITAIRSADADNNPSTISDATWLPEVGKTAADPSYPGAHAVISAGGASVLRMFLGVNQFHFPVTSEVVPGVVRTFDSIGAAEQEASLSRVYAGVHFRTDEAAGDRLGRAIADFVVDNYLNPVDRHEDREVDDK